MSEKNPTPVENANGESATVPDPEPLAPQPSGDASVTVESVSSRVRKDVTAKVVSPFWCTSYTFVTSSDETLVIDRVGTLVPKADLEDLLAAAARQGVLLSTEVSD